MQVLQFSISVPCNFLVTVLGMKYIPEEKVYFSVLELFMLKPKSIDISTTYVESCSSVGATFYCVVLTVFSIVVELWQ